MRDAAHVPCLGLWWPRALDAVFMPTPSTPTLSHSHRRECRAWSTLEVELADAQALPLEESSRFVGLPFKTRDINPATVCLEMRRQKLSRFGCFVRLQDVMGLGVSVPPAPLCCW